MALDTIEAVEQYDITTGYPVKLALTAQSLTAGL